jgi:hypothetical protein
MLSQRLILLSCLFVLFVSAAAQSLNRKVPNNDPEQDDDDDDVGQDEQRQQSKNKNPLNNNDNEKGPEQPPPPAKKLDVGIVRPAAPVLAPPPPPPPAPAPAAQRQVPSASVVRSPVTPISSSPECRTDVQKYCNKGNEKVLANLKVLQCIDDLDNVSIAIDPRV